MKVVLASSSPRRSDLLALTGILFEVVHAHIEEIMLDSPFDTALENAKRKAISVHEKNGDSLVIAADTIVHIEQTIYGKPENEKCAFDMLSSLSGRSHLVSTGVFFIGPDGANYGFVETTMVDFKPLKIEDVETYIQTGEWKGKAGGYAIQGQGSGLVEMIDGSFSNVVGLPLERVVEVLERFSITCDPIELPRWKR